MSLLYFLLLGTVPVYCTCVSSWIGSIGHNASSGFSMAQSLHSLIVCVLSCAVTWNRGEEASLHAIFYFKEEKYIILLWCCLQVLLNNYICYISLHLHWSLRFREGRPQRQHCCSLSSSARVSVSPTVLSKADVCLIHCFVCASLMWWFSLFFSPVICSLSVGSSNDRQRHIRKGVERRDNRGKNRNGELPISLSGVPSATSSSTSLSWDLVLLIWWGSVCLLVCGVVPLLTRLHSSGVNGTLNL